MIVKLAVSFFCSLIITYLVGRVLVPALRRVKAGQSIKEDGPVWHMSKQGTPTMGGLMFICAIAIVCLSVGIEEIANGSYGHLFVLLLAMLYGAIGFFDDYEKLKKKQNTGLTAKQKFLLQLACAIAFIYLLRLFGYLKPNLYVPFINITIPLPEIVYFVFAAFVMVGCVNAVNITDGVDGLAAGVSVPVAACYTAVSYIWGYTELGIFAAALTGGLVGFLIFNFHPAKVFMGDTGSLFLGGAICAMAFALDMPLILVTLGIVYIIETLSDIIQVAYFKLTHGKRVFKMAPLHHHFEMCGWSEKKLFIVFTGVSAIFAVISFIGVLDRYGL